MQGDFYTKGKYGEAGLQPFDMEKAINELADYVVFNGSVGAISGEKALVANVGETIRLYVGNGGPNLVSSFHVIGEIFDRVNVEGGTVVNENVQTTLVPAGGSSIVEFTVDVPGTLLVVDHSIFRAFNKGALGMINVEGPASPSIYSGKQFDSVYLPEGSAIQSIPGETQKLDIANSLAEQIRFGKRVYETNCQACHQAGGIGIPRAFPPLAKSDFLNQDHQRAIDVLLHGMSGRVVVNGEQYNSSMPAIGLSDHDVADVLTFLLNNWDNDGGQIAPKQVEQRRLDGSPVQVGSAH